MSYPKRKSKRASSIRAKANSVGGECQSCYSPLHIDAMAVVYVPDNPGMITPLVLRESSVDTKEQFESKLRRSRVLCYNCCGEQGMTIR